VRANIAAADAEVARWIESDAYGKVLARPGISASLRERIGVVLLVAQGLRNQVKGHVRGAMNCGATREDVAAFVEAAAAWLPPAELAFARATVADA
jgi:alkylhydroperoxidase/carboxymuconolactone decarboxylase family protein YurZ